MKYLAAVDKEITDIVERAATANLSIRPFKGLIFLCGGRIDPNAEEPVSVRHALAERLERNSSLSHRVRMAEQIEDWREGGIYRDLVTFESHLASLSSVIVLAVESAGSIAELGLFSGIKAFQQKLLVLIDRPHYEDRSFIRLGPIGYLEEEFQNLASVESWSINGESGPTFCSTSAKDVSEQIENEIEARAAHSIESGKFSPDSWPHRSLLILELVALLQAAEFGEIKTLLTYFGVGMDQAELHRHLFMLERSSLLRRHAVGRLRLYYRDDPTRYLRFGIDQSKFDWDKACFDITQVYERSDRKRFLALRRLRDSDD